MGSALSSIEEPLPAPVLVPSNSRINLDPTVVSTVVLGLIAISTIVFESRKKPSSAPVKLNDKPLGDDSKIKSSRKKPTELILAEYTFFFGVMNVIFQVWIVSVFPWNYFLWHFVKNSVYLIIRFKDFSLTKELWYLSEFCRCL